MPATRPVQSAGFLIAGVLLACSTAFAGAVEMTSPTPDDILYGPSRFSFRVEPADPPIESIDVFVGGKLIGSATAPEWAIEWDAPRSAVGETVSAAAYTRDGLLRLLESKTRFVPFHEEVQSALVQLFPVVLDKKGRYVSDLAGEDFAVLDQGSPVDIENFSVRADSLNLAILLDVSDSMELKLAKVQEASLRFVEQLQPEDRVAVYAFNHSLLRSSAMDDDRTETHRSIRALRSEGGTALYDALFRVLDDLSDRRGRKALFVFSDGRDERSLISLDTVVRAAHESLVILFAVTALEQGEAEEAREQLETLAGSTGGQAFTLKSLDMLDDAFDRVLGHLRAQYVLSYTPPEGKEGLRSVEVFVRQRGLSVLCRDSYFYSGAP